MTAPVEELVDLAQERARTGLCDLRDVGELLFGQWDQDGPAALLAALTSQAAEIKRLREALDNAATSNEANAKAIRKGGFYCSDMADAIERTAISARAALAEGKG